ncbi:hypothetical protein UA08_03373 [Talaromyces atroroseus]|uniref:endo-polygalacturonase n=1 Tax=Talaromyces atroroseus TaxID=1441469 RepID=A0A225AVZ0_TALAT|nr:hypothetical protein UA08_03373 [Talaromyces atroroseus]OKL61468.1 hypothetical protein UA08_03373 [Talaromyces atroroseus]
MRSALFLSFFLPLALGCDNPAEHACAAVYTASRSAVNEFCATFTTETVTATTGLPEWASACSFEPKKLSSACSCLGTAWTTTSADATATSSIPTATSPTESLTVVSSSAQSTLLTTTRPASRSTVSATVPTSTASPTTTSFSSSTSVSTVSAAPVTTAPTVATESACVVTEYASISSAVKSCTNIVLSNISAPPSSTINLQSLQTGATVTFAGTTTFGDTYDKDFDTIVISGTNVTITGAEGHVIDGNGQAYWDGKGSNGGQAKPNHFIVVKDFYYSEITNLNIQNWPVHCFEIENVEHVTIAGLLLNNTAGDEPNDRSGKKAAAHNTDGFDISKSEHVTLQDTSVYNQDDCVAVTSGSQIVVSNMYCSGGHGLSIGSVGGKSDNTVDGVTFENSQIVNSENGCRVKSNAETTGSVSNVIYQNITISDITDYGIDVQQDYLNGGATGKPTTGVPFTGFSFIDITGTVTDDGKDYYILCGDGSCSDFTFSGVSITGGGKTSSCNYPDSGCP